MFPNGFSVDSSYHIFLSKWSSKSAPANEIMNLLIGDVGLVDHQSFFQIFQFEEVRKHLFLESCEVINLQLALQLGHRKN